MIIATIGFQKYEMNDLQSATELLRILDESKPIESTLVNGGFIYVECDPHRAEIAVERGQSFSKDDYNALLSLKNEAA